MKSLAVLTATLLAFASCQQEINLVESGVSHTLKFVAGAPETKTSFEVEGAVVNYSWSETDATDHSTGDTKRPEKFQVFENGVAATSINAELTDGEMWIEATFEGQRPQQAEYRALFNAGVKFEQSSMDESYDQDSDVLVSNVLKNVDLEAEHLVFSFRREVAFGAVTLKGLDEGDYLLNVKIESDKPLAGDYDLVNESWKNTSTTLSIDSFNDIDGGEATLYFLTLPVESATLKMTVQTTDDLDNVKATYVKEFKKTISFSQGDVRPFNVTLEKQGGDLKPVEHTISWTGPSDWTTDSEKDEFSLTAQPYGYSVVLKKNNGGTTPTVNATAKDCRLYAKGTATISNDKEITKIVFNVSTQGKKRLAPITASVGTIAAQASGDETVVWTGQAKEVTFTVGDNANYGSDGSSKAGQLCFDTIDATYLSDGTEPEPEPTKYNITVAGSIVGGTVTASATEAAAGTEITLTATPAEGYDFGSWNVTNTSTSAAITVTDNKFTMPAANVNVSATFKKQSTGNSETYTFDEFTSAQDVTFNGTDITIEFHKGTGSTNPAWSSNQARLYAKGNVVVSSSTKNIVKVEYDYVINANKSGNVPTIDSVEGSTDKGTWDANAKTWTGSDSEVTLSTSGSAGNLGFTSITVYFGEGPTPVTKYDVTCATVANGTISASPTKAAEGATVTLSATPNTGYEFESWNVTNASTSAAITVTDNKFTMPAANVNVSATFKEKESEALTTMDEIFAKATEVGSTKTDVKVGFTNCVVTGVAGSNVYVVDANGTKGLIIYQANHGFEVGDKLNGEVNCQVYLYNGSSDLVGVTSTSSGLTVTKDGVVAPQTISIADLSGVNTGAVLSFAELTYNSTAFSDGTNTITPYKTFITLPTLVSGKKYSVTGVYIQYKDTKQIAPRTAEDIVEKAVPKYNVTIASGITNGTVTVDYTEATEGQIVTITATPNSGYKVKSVTAKKTVSGTALTVTSNKFTMPAEAVTVSAEFEENVGGGTLTLDKLGTSVGSTSNTAVATISVTATGSSTSSYTLNYLQGKKQGDAILLAKSTGAFISNKTPMPGNIKSVTVYINSGASGKTTYHCAFSPTECTSAYTTGSTAVNITGGNSNKYTCSVSDAKYFCISLGNANNGQVLKVEVEYE